MKGGTWFQRSAAGLVGEVTGPSRIRVFDQVLAHQVLHQAPVTFGRDREIAVVGEVGAGQSHRKRAHRQQRHDETDPFLEATLLPPKVSQRRAKC